MNNIEDLAKRLAISERKVNICILALEGKLSKEEVKNIENMYASCDSANHLVADEAINTLMQAYL